MATHFSVLAWRTPGMEKLPFMGSHRVGHDWSDLVVAAAAGDRFAVDNGPGARSGVLIRSLGLTDVNYYIQNG